MRKLNKDAVDIVVYVPTGFLLDYQAWRKKATYLAQVLCELPR